MQITILTAFITPRLQYICDFIFSQYLGLSYRLTTATDEKDIVLVVYGNDELHPQSFHVPAHGLLSETGLRDVQPDIKKLHDLPVLFPMEGRDLDFDIFSATFYLLSRYEESLPYEPDMYGRFPHTSSIAFRNDFLHIPLISYWLMQFKKSLQKHYPELEFRKRQFSYTPTYDIDIAYSYKGKGIMRNLGGFIQSPSLTRIRVNLGMKKDPFDAYDFLDQLHSNYGLQPIYFFLLANKKGKYDKNLAPEGNSMKELIQRHAKKYIVGIHPSWESYQDTEMIKEEIEILQKHCIQAITKSRQHYIKMNLPKSYHVLIEAGIKDDYSMGYGSINGFRASVAEPFYWYDLNAEQVTTLKIHPFCYMDANSFFEQKLGPEQASDQLLHYFNECEKTNSPLITIFHNDFLGTEKMFEGYRDMYSGFIKEHAIPAH